MVELYKFDPKALDFAREILGFDVNDLPPDELYFMFNEDARLNGSDLITSEISYTNRGGTVSKLYIVMWGDGNGVERTAGKPKKGDSYIFDPKAVKEAEKMLGYSLEGLEGIDLYFVFSQDPDISQDERFVVRAITDIDLEGKPLRTSYTVWFKNGNKWMHKNRISSYMDEHFLEGNESKELALVEIRPDTVKLMDSWAYEEDGEIVLRNDRRDDFDNKRDWEFDLGNRFSSSGIYAEDRLDPTDSIDLSIFIDRIRGSYWNNGNKLNPPSNGTESEMN